MSGKRSQGPQPASGPQARGIRRRARPAIRRAMVLGLGLLLALGCVLLPGSGPAGQALAWSLPGRSPARAAGTTAGSGSNGAGTNGTTGRIQEVAPPAAVQQLNAALAPRQPRLTILEPADGALLPDGPWTLRLQVEDWPLVDAGPLGLGPHLLVQLDDGLPTPLVDTTLTLPSLTPGSHRLTVMAARPSGEVLKRPGAFQQIRLHRVAPNPLSLPAPGSPQLLPVSPLGASPGDPVLVDWLLIDAPLQNLRADDARWRLRVSVNGDSFLVDQQMPLWLKGWRPGSNALLLELVDGRGEPLNPPFNSSVREVILRGGASRPAWLGGRLSEADLARLLGEAGPEIAPAPLPAVAEMPATASPEPPAAATPMPEPEPATAEPTDPEPATPAATTALSPNSAEPMPAAPIAAPEVDSGLPAEPAGSPPQPSAVSLAPAGAAVEARPTSREQAAAPAPSPAPAAAVPAPLLPPGGQSVSHSPPTQATPPRTSPTASTAEPASSTAVAPPEAPDASPPATATTPRPPTTAPGAPPPSGEREPEGASPRRSAREEVNSDGTLIRPARRSPLEALRARLQR